jgi:flagellar hook-basal body complex protein FliE
VDAISSLPSLSELLRQNSNISPAQTLRPSGEYVAGASMYSPSVPNIESLRNAGVGQVDRVSPTDRVTAPGFADMFEKFVKGVDQKKKVSTQQTKDLILGRSDNIHEAVVKSEEAKVAFNLMIEVRNKLVDSYKELMRMQV